jgi:hypothetical protein
MVLLWFICPLTYSLLFSSWPLTSLHVSILQDISCRAQYLSPPCCAAHLKFFYRSSYGIMIILRVFRCSSVSLVVILGVHTVLPCRGQLLQEQ